MALFLLSPDSEVVGTGTSPTINEPAGTSPGDLLVLVCAADLSGAMQSIIPGYTRFQNIQALVFSSFFGVRRRGSTPISLTLTLTGSVYREAYLFTIHSNVTWPVVDSISPNGTTVPTATGPQNPNPPALSTVGQSPGIYFCCGIWWSGSAAGAGWTMPAGYSAPNSNTSGEDIAIASKAFTTPGLEDPAAFGNGGATNNDLWNGFTVAFVEAEPTYYKVGKNMVRRAPSEVPVTPNPQLMPLDFA